MRMKKMFATLTVIFFSLVAYQVVHASPPANMHIKIENSLDPSPVTGAYTQTGGWTVIHPTHGGSSSCPSGTNNQYTITGTPTFDGDDGTSDYARFHNLTITATSVPSGNSVCGHIYFWAKYTFDPLGAIDFRLTSTGSLSKGDPSTGWALFSAWLQHYPDGSLPGLGDGFSGSWEHVGSTSGPLVSSPAQDKHSNALKNVGFAMLTEEVPELQGIQHPRIMKGEIWFSLKQNQQLILNSNTGVTVETAAAGGDGDGRKRPSFWDYVDETPDPRGMMLRLDRLEKYLKLPPLPGPIPPEPLDKLDKKE